MIMGNVDKSARSENGESAGTIEAGNVCRAVLDLKTKAESMSTHGCPVTGLVIYLGTVKRGARASSIGDAEGVFGEGSQGPTGIFEEFESFVTWVAVTFKFSGPST